MRFPIDQEIEAKKQIKKTKQILAECEEQEKEWRIKEQEEIWRIKMDQNNLKKELEKKDIRKAQNYFIFFLLGFISALVIEKFI